MTIKQFLWWWGPVIVWCGLIFWLSSTPNLKVGDGLSDYALRKTAHMVEYGLLFLLMYRALIKGAFAQWDIRVAIGAGLLAVAYAASDELHQRFVPTRSGLWTDLVFDAAGVGIALTGLAWWGWWNKVLQDTKPSSE